MKTSVRKAKSVVVVEDQTAICELIIEMLEARGAYRVLGSTADGNEGLALAKQLKPDILILDILLPGISGLAEFGKAGALRHVAAHPGLEQATGDLLLGLRGEDQHLEVGLRVV